MFKNIMSKIGESLIFIGLSLIAILVVLVVIGIIFISLIFISFVICIYCITFILTGGKQPFIFKVS